MPIAPIPGPREIAYPACRSCLVRFGPGESSLQPADRQARSREEALAGTAALPGPSAPRNATDTFDRCAALRANRRIFRGIAAKLVTHLLIFLL